MSGAVVSLRDLERFGFAVLRLWGLLLDASGVGAMSSHDITTCYEYRTSIISSSNGLEIERTESTFKVFQGSSSL